MTVFRELGLAEQVIRGVDKSGYTVPTPIQMSAIPVAMGGGDLTGCAQTGTGKTAAFVLPMLSRLTINIDKSNDSSSDKNRSGGNNNVRRPRTRVRALVVTPTRELAVQVANAVRTYGAFTGLRSVAVYGGVGMGPQIDAFRRGVEIVIATPGRLLDHIDRGNLDLSSVEMLVIDEADRMFDMGFINDIRKIVASMPKERQTLLFSATMPAAVEKLAAQIQRNPSLVEVGERTNPAETVEQIVYGIAQDKKVDLVFHVLKNEMTGSMLIFTRTKHRADQVTNKLNRAGIRATAIHSNRSQSQRQSALDGFRRGNYRVLVATDIAARGIDVDGISHVVNFDTPTNPEDYIHRIGRTGRAQTTGVAMTFVSHDESDGLRGIERFIRKTITRGEVEGLTHEITMGSGGGRSSSNRRQGGGGYGGGQRSGGYGGGNRSGGGGRSGGYGGNRSGGSSSNGGSSNGGSYGGSSNGGSSSGGNRAERRSSGGSSYAGQSGSGSRRTSERPSFSGRGEGYGGSRTRSESNGGYQGGNGNGGGSNGFSSGRTYDTSTEEVIGGNGEVKLRRRRK